MYVHNIYSRFKINSKYKDKGNPFTLNIKHEDIYEILKIQSQSNYSQLFSAQCLTLLLLQFWQGMESRL